MNNTAAQHAGFRWPTAAPTQGNPQVAATPPPSPDKPRSIRCKLRTIGDVSHELAKLYREARSGAIDTSEASKLANILALLARTMTDSEIESRLEALEQRGY